MIHRSPVGPTQQWLSGSNQLSLWLHYEPIGIYDCHIVVPSEIELSAK